MSSERLEGKVRSRFALPMGVCFMTLLLFSPLCSAEIVERAVFQGNTYYLLRGNGFDQLEAEAVSLGGHLTSVNSQAEQDFIWDRWGKEETNLCIGFTDRAEEGKFAWISGESVVYTNWGPGEPNNHMGNEDFAAMSGYQGANGLWNDLPGCDGLAVAKVAGLPKPQVSRGSVTNAASFVPDGLPNSGIARGAMFVAFGVGLGPQTLQSHSTLPLPTRLAETSVAVAVGSQTVEAFLVYTSDRQVAAVLPSRTPVGQGTLTVTYEGEPSDPVPIRVVESAFGIFARNQAGFGPAIAQNFVSPAEMPLNALTRAAAPGQAVVLWGTGLGPIAESDAGTPPVGNLPVDIEVLLGGVVSVRPFYAGRSPQFPAIDQVNFIIPENAPRGCYVPVAVRVGDRISNYASISISSQGRYCSDAVTFSAEVLETAERNGGLRIGLVEMARMVFIEPSSPVPERDDDVRADFYSQKLNQLLAGGEPWGWPFPPPGACAVFSDLNDDPLPDDLMEGFRTKLDAGPAIHVRGPKGSARLERKAPRQYYEGPVEDDFIEAGLYTADNASGGNDIGGFTATLNVPNLATWTNKANLTTVSRASDLTFTWTGGDLADGFVGILGQSEGSVEGATGSFLCTERASAGSFSVPARILSSLPATAEGPVNDNSLLMVVGVRGRRSSTFTAPGLDLGLFGYVNIDGVPATFK